MIENVFTASGKCQLVSNDPKQNKQFALICQYAEGILLGDKKYDTMSTPEIVNDLLSTDHGFDKDWAEQIFTNVAVNSLLDSIIESR